MDKQRKIISKKVQVIGKQKQAGHGNAPIIESYNVIEAYLPSMQPKNTLAQPPDQETAN